MPQLPSSFIPDDTQPEAQPVTQAPAPKQAFSTLFNDPERQIKAKPQPAPPAPKPTPSPELPNPRYAIAEHMKPLSDPTQPILDIGGVVTRGGEKAKAEHPDMSDTRRMLIDMGEAGAEVAGSLTSPANLVLMASGIGEGSTLIRALMNVGFKASMAWSAADNLWKAHKAWKAYKASGDKSKLDEAVKDWTASGINSLFLGAGGQDKEPVKPPPGGSIVSSIAREGQKRLPGAPPPPVEASPPAAPPDAPGVPRLPGVVAETKQQTKHPETGRRYSSTQVELPKSLADDVKKAASSIADQDLFGDGREVRPHITVKYGINEPVKAADVRKLLAQENPVTVTLGDISTFPDSGDGEVVKVDVDSADLHRLNSKISQSLPVTDTHPEYKPHVTLAYVKPGAGAKYVGSKLLKGKQAVIDKVTFSGRDGKEEEIPLAMPPSTLPKPKALTGGTTGGAALARIDLIPHEDRWYAVDRGTGQVVASGETAAEAERSVGADLHPAPQTETRQEPIREAQAEPEPVVSAPVVPTAPVEVTPEFRDWRPQGRTIRHSTPGKHREKVDKKTGLTKSQKEFTSTKLAEAAEQFAAAPVAAPQLPISIQIPGDGTFTIKSKEAASTLHKTITGKPLPDIEPLQRSAFQPHSESFRYKPSGTPDIEQAARRASEAYGGATKAIAAIDAQMAMLEQDPETLVTLDTSKVAAIRNQLETLGAQEKKALQQEVQIDKQVEEAAKKGKPEDKAIITAESEHWRPAVRERHAQAALRNKLVAPPELPSVNLETKEPWKMTELEYNRSREIEPPVPEGHTRLYRGEKIGSAQPTGSLRGNWFSQAREAAEFFAFDRDEGKGKYHVVYVDVPTSSLHQFDPSRFPEKRTGYVPSGEQAYIVTKDVASRKRELFTTESYEHMINRYKKLGYSMEHDR